MLVLLCPDISLGCFHKAAVSPEARATMGPEQPSFLLQLQNGWCFLLMLSAWPSLVSRSCMDQGAWIRTGYEHWAPMASEAPHSSS